MEAAGPQTKVSTVDSSFKKMGECKIKEVSGTGVESTRFSEPSYSVRQDDGDGLAHQDKRSDEGKCANLCDGDGRSRSMPPAQVAPIRLEEGTSDDRNPGFLRVPSNSRSAAQVAPIPLQDSLSEGRNYGSRRPPTSPRSILTRTHGSVTLQRMMTTEALRQGLNVDSDNGSSFLSDDTESSIFDEESDEGDELNELAELDDLDEQNESSATWTSFHNNVSRKCSWNSDGKHVSPVDSEDSEEDEAVTKSHRKRISGTSFSALSSSLKWSIVKSKVLYSFRGLRSVKDDSRTICVKNLALEVTYDVLYDYFRSSGSIVDIRITRDPGRAGPSSACVEFESGANVRKAVQKNGKTLQGRIILVAIADERSKQSSETAGSVNGKKQKQKQKQSQLSREDSTTAIGGRGYVNNQLASNFLESKLSDADAKFLSRFNQSLNSQYAPRSSFSPDQLQLVSPMTNTIIDGSREIFPAPWPRSYSNPLSNWDDFDEDTPVQEPSSTTNWKTSWPWKRWRKNVKFAKLLLPWRKSRQRWWQVAKITSMNFASKGCSGASDIQQPTRKTLRQHLQSTG